MLAIQISVMPAKTHYTHTHTHTHTHTQTFSLSPNTATHPNPTHLQPNRDLLADGAARSADAGRITDANAIKHDASGGHTTVAGASRVPVAGADHAADLVRRASDARACAETAMNSTSSRSHCVFMLYIRGLHAASGTRLAGCLCLVDLAGRCAEAWGQGSGLGGRRGLGRAVQERL